MPALPRRSLLTNSCLFALCALWWSTAPLRGGVIIAEGESFRPADAKGWKLTHQNDSYGSHTYGGMWMTHGACLGAPAASVGSVATRTIQVPDAGKYRVWSKYQAPPYFHYQHRIEIVQHGKPVFSHVYGKKGTDRLWSFSGVSDELWWPWGVDHDCAEGAPQPVELVAGPAEVRLITVANPQPAGDRFVDFLVLTTNLSDDYKGFKPNAVGSPFANEALEATRLFLRFQNTTGKEAQLSVSRSGHFQPQYGGATTKVPASPVAAGQWSPWINIGPFCKLVHDEGLTLQLASGSNIPFQFARDEAGKDLVGEGKVLSGEAVVVPLEITWKQDARVKPSRVLASEILQASAHWRKANGGKKPKDILFYGAFRGPDDWVYELKAGLGYNTQLPAAYDQAKVAGYHQHSHNLNEIEAFAKGLKEKENLRVLSFGDEIGLGTVNFKDPKLQDKFRAWLKARKVTRDDLGVDPEQATLTTQGNTRLVWFSQLFSNEEVFAKYRLMTETARKRLGPQVLTGANYSPHHGCLYYGSVPQWIDIFKHQGMSMFWAEDYIFSVPEPPQILSWMFAQIRCAVKYHQQPIHFYVMPHAPGQEPAFLRRNHAVALGFGTRHIDHFWVAPAERFTENYVSWSYPETFRVLSESIYDAAEVERFQVGGKVRPARVAVVLSRATDYHEARLKLPKEQDPFARQCKNAEKTVVQTLCRKDQQMLYLALRQAQHAVDLITEDDILDGSLKDLDVVYFAGEWIDNRVVPQLEAWVKTGGVLYACAGLGHRNQYDEPDTALLKLLGLKAAPLQKNAVHLRTLLELPLCPEIDTIQLDKEVIPALALRQALQPESARVLGTWKDGSAAVTVRELGQGKALAVGTLAGTSWMKTGLRPIPWARGGRHTLYNPVDFTPAATALVRLGVDARKLEPAVSCSIPGIEGIVIDHPAGHLVTLVNWTNNPVRNLQIRVRLPAAPKQVRSVTLQDGVPSKFADGVLTFTVNLGEVDYFVMPKQ